MNKEELLEEAKLRYPVGCKFKSAYNGNLETCDIEPFYYKYYDNDIAARSEGGVIYYKNKWAEIVSYPEDYIPPTESILKNVIIW